MKKQPTIDAVILSYKRRKHLEAVVRGVRCQSMVRDIYVFHNAPSKGRAKGCINIFSEKNFGCLPRHAIALLSDADYVLFLDDDTELCVDLSERFLSGVKKFPKSILGLFGRDINEHVAKKKLYPSGGYYDETSYARYVDVIVGRLLLCKREWFQYLFALPFYVDHFEEDIMLNLSVQMALAHPSVMLHSNQKEYRTLTIDHGMNERVGHYVDRSLTVHACMKHGWTSLRKKRTFAVHNKTALKQIEKRQHQRKALVQRLCVAYDKGAVSQAENIEDKLLAMGQENAYYLYVVAGELMADKKARYAKKLYQRVAKGAHDWDYELKGLAFFKQGLIAVEQGKLQQARRHFKKCISLYPAHKKAKVLMKALQR